MRLGDDVRFRQLRHSRITEVARMGLNPLQVMMVSGQRDIRSVQRYTHLNVRDVIDLIDQFGPNLPFVLSDCAAGSSHRTGYALRPRNLASPEGRSAEKRIWFPLAQENGGRLINRNAAHRTLQCTAFYTCAKNRVTRSYRRGICPTSPVSLGPLWDARPS